MDAIRLEFGAADGSYSQGFAALPDLIRALRSDIGLHLKPEYREEFAADVPSLLQILSAPNRMFDFDVLTDIFARQLIPTQALQRSGDPVFFTPARLSLLGLP
jgi:hypothetical protein